MVIFSYFLFVVIEFVVFFLGIIECSLDLMAVFFDFGFLKIVLPIALIVINFERIYLVVMWIARKIPVAGIE